MSLPQFTLAPSPYGADRYVLTFGYGKGKEKSVPSEDYDYLAFIMSELASRKPPTIEFAIAILPILKDKYAALQWTEDDEEASDVNGY